MHIATLNYAPCTNNITEAWNNTIVIRLVTSIPRYGNPSSAYSTNVWAPLISMMRLATHPRNTGRTRTSDCRHDWGTFAVIMSNWCLNSLQPLAIWFGCRNTPLNTTTVLDTTNTTTHDIPNAQHWKSYINNWIHVSVCIKLLLNTQP